MDFAIYFYSPIKYIKRYTRILGTLIDCTFFDRRQTQTCVAGINLQGYNGFLDNVKQLKLI
jgi:hypothetical protein